ncbi:MAG: hypothetical protein PHT78_08950 [Desulfitobacteriaceae bacterium]|nr:hypothetical protein [Desulfitobacteriaceae bacterium]
MDFTVESLKQNGFLGFISIADLWNQGCDFIPQKQGIYVIIRKSTYLPEFLPNSVGGWFKNEDPTVDVEFLKQNWVEDVNLLYIGKAGGPTSERTLRDRIEQFIMFGRGKRVAHKGGKLIWQLKNHSELLVAFKPLPDNETPEFLIREFEAMYGKKPFANLHK